MAESGLRDSYSDPEIRRRVISEMVSFVERTSAPLLLRLGMDFDKYMNFVNWKGRKYEWLRDTLPAKSDPLATAIGDTTTQAIGVTNGNVFRVGHIIEIGSERMYVDGKMNNTLTVRRGFQGTTSATHTTPSTVSVVGLAKQEGANYVLGPTTTMDSLFNHTQIIEESIEVTNTQAEIKDYGVDDTMAYHLAKLIGGNSAIGSKGKAGTLLLQLAEIAYHGIRFESGNLRTAGGLKTFIPDGSSILPDAPSRRYGSSSTLLTRQLIEQAQREIVDFGGRPPDLLVCNAATKAEISSWYEGLRRTTRTERTGGDYVDMLETDFGSIELMYDWMCPAGEVYLLESECVGWCTFRPFDIVDIPALADSKQKAVIGEYGFGMTRPENHALITFDPDLLSV